MARRGASSSSFAATLRPRFATRRCAPTSSPTSKSQIEGSDEWSRPRRDELASKLRTTPALFRLLRRIGDGKLRIDKAAIAGSPGSTASGCCVPLRHAHAGRHRRRLQATPRSRTEMTRHERGAAASTGVPSPRGADPQLPPAPLARIAAHPRENGAGDTRRNIRPKLDRMHFAALETAERRIAQRSPTTPGQVKILKVLEFANPVRSLDFDLPESLPWSQVAGHEITPSCSSVAPILPAQRPLLHVRVPVVSVSPDGRGPFFCPSVARLAHTMEQPTWGVGYCMRPGLTGTNRGLASHTPNESSAEDISGRLITQPTLLRSRQAKSRSDDHHPRGRPVTKLLFATREDRVAGVHRAIGGSGLGVELSGASPSQLGQQFIDGPLELARGGHHRHPAQTGDIRLRDWRSSLQNHSASVR